MTSQFDSLEELYEEFRNDIEFRMIYISEVHSIDSDLWSITLAKEKKIYQHKDADARAEVATMMCADTGLSIPVLVDGMDNAVADLYGAYPTRICLIGIDGRIVATNSNGPLDIRKALERSRKWMTEFQRNRSARSLGSVQ